MIVKFTKYKETLQCNLAYVIVIIMDQNKKLCGFPHEFHEVVCEQLLNLLDSSGDICVERHKNTYGANWDPFMMPSSLLMSSTYHNFLSSYI